MRLVGGDELFSVENYFNYFTEIEERYLGRRGSGLLLSTLDWALIETWKDARIPLEAVLRGIDAAFDTYDRRPSKTRKINSLTYCAQEVLSAAEDMKEAAVGATRPEPRPIPGMGPADIASFLRRNAAILLPAGAPGPVQTVARECSAALEEMAATLEAAVDRAPDRLGDRPYLPPRLEDLERHLTVLEEKLLAALTMTASEADLLALRSEADREIAPYRSRMPGLQIEQLRKQFVHKRLFEKAKMPRLSLFYM
ncbi:MAG TPA: hypothetical protein VI488_01715 [Candidatus Angelobacter sp.]